MKKILLFFVIALIAASCSQSKQTTKVTPRDEVHRYSTVYEGNKIIKYDLSKNKVVQNGPNSRKIEPIIPESGFKMDRPVIENLPNTDLARESKRKKTRGFFPFELFRPNKKESAQQSGGGWIGTHPGTFSIILYGGAILFFWIPFLSGLLGLAALVFAIIGVVKKESQTDLILAWIVLGLFLLGVLILILAVAAGAAGV